MKATKKNTATGKAQPTQAKSRPQTAVVEGKDGNLISKAAMAEYSKMISAEKATPEK